MLAYCADSTTVARPIRSRRNGGWQEEYVRVQGVAGPEAVENLAAVLQRVHGASGPIKWRSDRVRDFVLDRTSGSSSLARAQLHRIAIVVVDPMQPIIELDRHFLDCGHGRPTWSLYLRSPRLATDRQTAPIVDWVRRRTVDEVLRGSGVGELDELIRLAQADPFRLTPRSPSMLSQMSATIGTHLSKAAKLAMQSSALLIAERSDGGRQRKLENALEPTGVADPLVASERSKRRLDEIARTKIAFDIGEEATDEVAKLRRTAEFIANDEISFGAPASARGFVRSVADDDSLRMQIADVAAGYAAMTIERGGLAELVRKFELVVVNNARLAEADAIRWDLERTWHRGIVAREIGQE